MVLLLSVTLPHLDQGDFRKDSARYAAVGLTAAWLAPWAFVRLRLAEGAYDRTVAGCVSGANGISPGLTMQQEGTVAEGAVPDDRGTHAAQTAISANTAAATGAPSRTRGTSR